MITLSKMTLLCTMPEWVYNWSMEWSRILRYVNWLIFLRRSLKVTKYNPTQISFYFIQFIFPNLRQPVAKKPWRNGKIAVRTVRINQLSRMNQLNMTEIMNEIHDIWKGKLIGQFILIIMWLANLYFATDKYNERIDRSLTHTFLIFVVKVNVKYLFLLLETYHIIMIELLKLSKFCAIHLRSLNLLEQFATMFT